LWGTSPPKSFAKGRKNSETDCLIYDEPIVKTALAMKQCFVRGVVKGGYTEDVLG